MDHTPSSETHGRHWALKDESASLAGPDLSQRQRAAGNRLLSIIQLALEAARADLSTAELQALRALLCHSPDKGALWLGLARHGLNQQPSSATVRHLGAANVLLQTGTDLTFHRGNLAMQLAMDEIATTCGRRVLQADRGDWRAHALLAVVLGERGKLRDGLFHAHCAILLAPDQSGPLNTALHLERSGPGRRHWRWLQTLAPNNADIAFHRSAALLAAGCWRIGWQAHRGRVLQPAYANVWRHPRAPVWDGSSVDHLLVCPEEGLGDQLRSLGFIAGIRQQAGSITLALHPRMQGIIRRNFPDLQIIDREAAAGQQFDTQILLEDIACHSIYRQPVFVADPDRVTAASARLANDRGWPRIGICWAAGTDPRVARRHRIPPELLADRLGRLGVTMVPLQHAPSAADLAVLSGYGIRQDPAIRPFGDVEDFAAEIAALDAVVSVTNTVAHLAGLLGVPTFGLTPYHGFWYWSVKAGERTVYPSTWYASATVYRQDDPDHWAAPLDRAISDLQAMLGLCAS